MTKCGRGSEEKNEYQSQEEKTFDIATEYAPTVEEN